MAIGSSLRSNGSFGHLFLPLTVAIVEVDEDETLIASLRLC